MIRHLAAATLALLVAAALPAAASPFIISGWKCEAVGDHAGVRSPVPQQVFFSAKAVTRPGAQAAAMRKCKASHDVSPSSCTDRTCTRAEVTH